VILVRPLFDAARFDILVPRRKEKRRIKMRKLMTLTLCVIAAFQVVSAQKAQPTNDRLEDIKAARAEAALNKSKWSAPTTGAKNAADTDDFYDTASFDKNVKFLGAFYAGTLYVYRSCDPAILLDELGITLAADDKCVAHSVGAPMATTTVSDPVWQITIPGKTIDNVIYPLLNNNVGYESYGTTAGPISLFYSPRVTIESSALTDPAAIDPTTGLPMNGVFTTSLSGSKSRGFWSSGTDYSFDYDTYASVSSRGLSRDYFSAIGLPQHVIDKLFKKPMTLKFSLRARVSGPVDYGQFYFTYRLLGN
jgi:hypothetical protein